MSLHYRNLFYTFIVITIVISTACSTTKKVADDSGSRREDSIRVARESMSDLQLMLDNNRSELSDVYATQRQDMPSVFLKKSSSDESINSDPFDGYRIQIISTKNVQLADSVANAFRVWSDTTIVGYSAKAYVFFKQPFYKVHVGDFHNRDKADDFTQLVKHNYPDAWVVHDRIDPSNMPADTTSFSIIKPGEKKEVKSGSIQK